MEKPEIIKGKNRVTFIRPLSDQQTKATLVPYQTSLTFDPSVDTDSTATKDGNVNSTSPAETDWEFEFINNTAGISDRILTALFAGEKMEIWMVNRARKNAEGKFESWYGIGLVTEDFSDNDADDNSTREITMTIDGEPKHGWTPLDAETQAEIDYVFHGIMPVTDDDATGQGDAWKTEDEGVNVVDNDNPVAVTGVVLDPKTVSLEVGKTTKLAAAVAPASATDKTVKYTSSDVKIATVGTDGTVTGVAAGKATITATAGTKTDTADVTVTAA